MSFRSAFSAARVGIVSTRNWSDGPVTRGAFACFGKSPDRLRSTKLVLALVCRISGLSRSRNLIVELVALLQLALTDEHQTGDEKNSAHAAGNTSTDGSGDSATGADSDCFFDETGLIFDVTSDDC